MYGDTRLGRALVGPSALVPGMIRVGEDMEGSELAAEPSGNAVYLLWNEGPPDTSPPPRHPTVYHFLLDNAATVGRYEPPPTGAGQ